MLLGLMAAAACSSPGPELSPEPIAARESAPAPSASAEPKPPSPAPTDPAEVEKGVEDFRQIARVLGSPRCRNCHPVGDAPLQGDVGKPHAMNISRTSFESGLPCTTCHREKNSKLMRGPPGVPNWHMPSRELPMVFEKKTPLELCEGVIDPARNGGRSLTQLREHLEKDPLVLWGWDPGLGRNRPPLPRDEFVKHVDGWIARGAPCP
jgi:hypothetical protein